MTIDVYYVLSLLILCLPGLAYACRQRWQPHAQRAVISAAVQRLLKPRMPHDCPACRSAAGRHPLLEGASAPVRPWREVKSRRGAPKRICTDGFACPTRTCTSYQVTDAQIHALVGDGTHGKHERIQTFRCQACKTTFSARRATPLDRFKTPTQRVGEVLTALAEGLDIAAAERVFGYRHATITTWLMRAGERSATLHDRFFHSLHLPHLQLDELRTRLRRRAYVVWLWVTIDPISKLIPVLYLGARTQASAHAVVHAVQQRLAPDCLPIFTSDGLNLYFYALTAHFGQWTASVGQRTCQWQVATDLIYGQVKKRYQRRRLVGVTHVLRCGTPQQSRTALIGLGLSGRLNTAFIERVNLTIRQSVAALMRRTWLTAQEAPQLLLHLEWWRAYYHFVRPHEALRVPLAQPLDRGGRRLPHRYHQRTPAMAGGLTSHRWTVQAMLTLPLESISAL